MRAFEHVSVKLACAVLAVLAGVVLVACKEQPVMSAAPEAAAPVVAGPAGWNHLTDATIIELHESSRAARHDVVVRFERDHDGFGWTAKVSPFPFTLGELRLDPSGNKFVACRCEVGKICPCEVSEHAVPAPTMKQGRIPAASLDAFLKLLASRAATASSDGGVSYRRASYVHVGIFAPSTEVHVVATDGAWTTNGKTIDGDGAALDASLASILAAVDVTSLLPPPPALPANFATMAQDAKTIEIRDEWNGLGNTHSAFIHLERAGATFKWSAKATSYSRAIGERVPDPSTPRDGSPCLCDVASSCPCEQPSKPLLKKNGTVPRAIVEAYLSEVSKHAISTGDDDRPSGFWTDDYPRGHVAVWSGSDPTPIHLSFLNQQRRWRVNGAELALEPPPPPGDSGPRSEHPAINGAYQKMLSAIGLSAWIEELSKGRSHH